MDIARLRAQVESLDGGGDGARGKKGRAVDEVIEALDVGRLRVSEPHGGRWVTHAWVKRAILLYFRRHDSVEVGGSGLYGYGGAWTRGPTWRALRYPPSYYDKVPTKRNYAALGARCVPPGVARYGSFLGRGTILMPGYVNVGAYVDDGSMIDTWATVGSCAQIGKNVHLSGGVGVGGVLEPPQAQPVIIEDGAFIGSRCVVVEGVLVGREAVLGAGVIVTAGTPVVDVRGAEAIVTKGHIPARAVVIPGTMPKAFAAGTYGVPCALVIGERTASTDRKTSLEAAIRDYGVAI
ncbi:MAG: 2,3,4,5-tetrahydropyridine-2,6-dicarboxylate N-succinyltransferase [Candidatus Eremiobacteraeota bacterium]|nr:2,3,4,5-tetrahydropyridine-2,6-dicarboxylate N-succinyltransferase [Candidatus Eremiobacteraeota bacterium]MBC5804485.1 2,3,4,5-tetrahydropyridine-2,6-dicarboxylate N-succinyltransferase [Candidatus Eremiobacteraeota bacterium]MBC5821635.1 2,3,4,5-tetrahydropyridine-2,6-dicarboxylate N-succinyltransferase [Candidatus Eremiobacteraeota bacterium]